MAISLRFGLLGNNRNVREVKRVADVIRILFSRQGDSSVHSLMFHQIKKEVTAAKVMNSLKTGKPDVCRFAERDKNCMNLLDNLF